MTPSSLPARPSNLSTSPVSAAAWDPQELVLSFIKDLHPRTKEIVIKRFGLDGDKPRTLEEIGKSYGVTRERVRQIQASALREFRASQALSVLRPIEDALETVIANHGHVMRHDAVLDAFSQQSGRSDVNPHVVEFVLELSNRFVHLPETERTHRAWATTQGGMDIPTKVMDAFIERLNEAGKPMPHEATVRCVLDHQVSQTHCDVITDEGVVASYLALSKEVRRNPFGEWGLSSWTEISPRGVKDKAYVVLKREAKPLHFTEITERINASGFAKRSAIPQTVHNELIKDRRFVLVGRGIYALSEWGYEAGTVADVAARVLEAAGKPMRRDEIVEEVLKQRLVKRNTVVLALQDKSRFGRTADGSYELVSASSKSAKSSNARSSKSSKKKA